MNPPTHKCPLCKDLCDLVKLSSIMLENINSCAVQFYAPFKSTIVCCFEISEPFGVIFMKTSGGENGEHRSVVVNWVNCSTDQRGSGGQSRDPLRWQTSICSAAIQPLRWAAVALAAAMPATAIRMGSR